MYTSTVRKCKALVWDKNKAAQHLFKPFELSQQNIWLFFDYVLWQPIAL